MPMPARATGLLIAGKRYQVPGLVIVGPGDEPWVKLNTGDYASRKTAWIRKLIAHTTKGIEKQHIIPGVGPGGSGKVVLDFWNGDPEHSAAQIVIDTNGVVYCACDLALIAAYHATYVNDNSIGIEIYQINGGGIYQASLTAWRILAEWLCSFFGIPKQVPHAYGGSPIHRLAQNDGAPDMCGVFGHRHQTSRRGFGDPGDFAFDAISNFRRVNFETREDLDIGRTRQNKLNAKGETLTVDGIWGPASNRAMLKHGFHDTIELDAP